MREVEFDKFRVIKYLIWTFALSYLGQVVVGILYRMKSNIMIWQLAMAVVMITPTLGVLLCGNGLKGLGWKLGFRKNIKTILIAWLLPAVLTAVGAILYFFVFPGHFDLSGGYIILMAGPEAMDSLSEQGMSYLLAVLVSVAASLTYGPFVNTFVSLGEEIGWRGFLYPQLRARFGHRKAWLMGGVIWGAWHWPVIWLIGYEYGATAGNSAGYWGFPVTGMLLFLFFTICWGAVADWLYERSGSIWLPSLCHGAINACFTIPLILCLTNTGSFRLLGPAPNGLLAGIPLIIATVILFIRTKENSKVEGK